VSRPKRKTRPCSGQPQKGATIICLEGASAAGKTTLSDEIAVRTGAAVIAEVWALFARPSPEPPLWYLEKQVERWRIALKSAEKHGLAILDGDPFQPLWYGWAYGFIEPHTLSTVTSFYRNAIAAGSLAFPDRLHTSRRRRVGVDGAQAGRRLTIASQLCQAREFASPSVALLRDNEYDLPGARLRPRCRRAGDYARRNRDLRNSQ
jgi:hypothetical protein